jgi:hypothetical protein
VGFVLNFLLVDVYIFLVLLSFLWSFGKRYDLLCVALSDQ